MIIRVSKSVDDVAGKPPALEVNDGACVYRVRVQHAGGHFEISVTNGGELQVRAIRGALAVEPRASNVVAIRKVKL